MPPPDGRRDRTNETPRERGEQRAARWSLQFDRLVFRSTTYGQRVGDVLIHSSVYLAFIAMVEVAIVTVLLSLEPNPAPVVVGLVTFSVYANDRLVDVDTDEVTNPRQAAFVRRHRNALYVLAATAYGLAVALSVTGGPVALAVTLLPGTCWVLYATDWLSPVNTRVQRLKEVLVVNSAVVALAWAVSLTFLPLAFVDAALTPTVAVVFGYFFLGTFVNTEIPNVYDMVGDRAVGVRTMPLVFGVTRTRQILYGIDLLTAALLVVAVLYGYLPVALAAPLFAGLVYSTCVTAFLGRTENGRLLTIAAECEYLFVGLLFVPIVYRL